MGFTSENSSSTGLQTGFLHSEHNSMSTHGSPGNDNSGHSPASRPRQLPGAACGECRRRKLRCDRQKPRCSACQAADVGCIVPAAKPARGPKRGYLKTLQERISILEGVLKEHQRIPPSSPVTEPAVSPSLDISAMKDMTGLREMGDILETGDVSDMSLSQLPWALDVVGELDSLPISHQIGPYQENDSISIFDNEEGWYTLPPDYTHKDLPSLVPVKESTTPSSNSTNRSGLQPPTTNHYDSAMSDLVQSDLDQLYMDRIHEFVPIVHHDSVRDAHMALRYAMWTLAASASVYHSALRDTLYYRTRQLLESPNPLGSNANIANTETIQAWLLLATHELMCVSFRHAWISAGRAFRLIQLDTTWVTEKGSIPDDGTPPPDQSQWVEAEKRRRTFWFAYCLDRLLSLRNGSHPTLRERVPMCLPCPDPAFQYSQPVLMGCLLDTDFLTSTIAPSRDPMSSFCECIVVATVAGRVLSHYLEATLNSSTQEKGQGINQHNGWDSLSSIDSLVAHSMRVFTTYHPPTAQERDPMLLFLAIAWRAIVIYVWHTAESMSTPVLNRNRAVKAKLSQQAENAAREMLRLMSKLAGWSSWKIHPLMNIPLSLCTELLIPRPDLMEAFTQKGKEITQATQGMRVFSTP
ncbi:hypothetical protein GQX73_g6993 [Xylaria multiplex]|uniref:Zn(2)-C6 fungal-type domain-containing protein n=1 Tax=Xylaria multiplex TaxID=323545 RepID=A0A7C8IPS3_9PEZI|nr:hypothetical protein GQX73_g6993 [Xylaria multiplex]